MTPAERAREIVNSQAGVKGFVAVPVADRFWAKVRKGGGCWEWTGSTDRRYGEFWVNGRKEKAHRVAWILTHGTEPPEQVCHRCDNPRCVRPDHLFLGSMSDNINDCVSKGRHAEANVTHCPSGHPYDADNTMRMGDGSRRCKACERRRKTAYDRLGYPLTGDTP